MAILACAIVLLVRDEVAGTFDESIWTHLYCVVLRGCIVGKFTYESGWLVSFDVEAPRSRISKFVNKFGGRRQPRRVLHIISDENEELYVGWDMRPIYSCGDGIAKSPNGKSYRFSKQLF